MELWIGKVAPNQAEPVEAIEQRHHRTTRGEAERAAEVPVLDQGELGREEPITWSRSPTAASAPGG